MKKYIHNTYVRIGANSGTILPKNHENYKSLLLTIRSHVFHFLSTCVGLVWLGQNCDEHGDGPVVVEDAKHEEDPPQNNRAMNMAHNHNEPNKTGDNKEDFAEVQPPPLVLDVVQQGIWQGCHVGHLLVREGEAGGGGEEPRPQPQETQESLDRLLWYF